MRFRYLIIILLVFSFGNTFSQNTYERWIITAEDEFVHRMNYLYGDMFIITAYRGEYTTNHIDKFFNYRNIIYRTDFELNLVDSLIIDQIEGHEILLNDFIKIDNQGMLYWGNALNTENMDEQLCFIWLDEDLNMVNNQIVGEENLIEFISDGIQTLNGNMLFAGSTSSQVLEGQYLLWEFDLNNQEINKLIHEEDVAYFPTLIEIPATSKFHVCSKYTTLQFDVDLNYETQYEFNNTINIIPDKQNKRISQNQYLKTGLFLSAPIPGYPWEMDLALTIMNENAEVVSDFTLGVADSLESVGRMDFVTTDTIYYGGSRNLILNPPENSWVSLYTTNLEGEEFAHRFWGGNGSYIFSDVVALPEGGFLMAATRWDFISNPDPMQRDIMLVMENYGNPVTHHEEHELLRPVSLNPNPGRNCIIINGLESDAHIFFYNEMGIQKYHSSVSPLHKLQVSHLKQGIYFYQLIKNGQLIDTGKWIKIND
jgi:hypothetical protein